MTNSPCPDCTHPIGATIGHTHNDSQSRRHRAPDGRTTAEIIADLRVAAVVGPRSDAERWLIRDAADRLDALSRDWTAVQDYDTSLCDEGLLGEFGRGWASCIHHLRHDPPR